MSSASSLPQRPYRILYSVHDSLLLPNLPARSAIMFILNSLILPDRPQEGTPSRQLAAIPSILLAREICNCRDDNPDSEGDFGTTTLAQISFIKLERRDDNGGWLRGMSCKVSR